MKPFFSFRVPHKRGKACILRRRWPLLCHQRFHQCGKGLSRLRIRTIYLDFGKARAFVIEKAFEVFTQVDQQMIAVSDLKRLLSALFDRLLQMEDKVCRNGNFHLPNWQTLNHFLASSLKSSFATASLP